MFQNKHIIREGSSMKTNLDSKNIFKLCIVMAVPCVLSQLVNLLYNIVDRMYIGQMADVGIDALAGLGLCAPLITIISAFASFVSGGGAPLASKALGENNEVKSRKILGNGLFLLIIFTVVLMSIIYIFMNPILNLIGASEKTLPYATSYLRIYLIGTIFVEISLGLNTFITAQGKSTLAMISVLIGAIINIALDPLFIFVFKMGISGAALATIISQFISSIFVIYILTRKKNILHLEIKNIIPSKEIIIAIFSIGCAPFVMAATESFIGFVLNRGLRDYGGDEYVSLLTIMQSSMLLISVPLSGFTQGVTPVISYNYGAKNKQNIIKAFKITAIVCFTYSMVLSILMIVFPQIFARFYTSDEVLINLCKKYLPIFILGMLIFGIQRACQTTFVALGQAKISLFIAILRKVILLIPLAVILPMFMGVSGIIIAEPIADALAATICTTIFIFRFRKIIHQL